MPKLGKNLHKHVHLFPKFEIIAHVLPIMRTIIRVNLNITPDFCWEDSYHGSTEPFWIIVEDNDSEKILHYEIIFIKKPKKPEASNDYGSTLYVFISEPLPPQYF